MSKLGFLARFLLFFALLLVVWNLTSAGDAYNAALLEVAALLGPAITGWILEPVVEGGFPRWVHESTGIDLQIQFDALAVGMVPLLALIAATPGPTWRRRVGLAALGAALFFAIDVAIVIVFPLLLHYDNAATDIGGTFLGMIGFVGAPVILWFALTFPYVRRWLPSLRASEDHT